MQTGSGTEEYRSAGVNDKHVRLLSFSSPLRAAWTAQPLCGHCGERNFVLVRPSNWNLLSAQRSEW